MIISGKNIRMDSVENPTMDEEINKNESQNVKIKLQLKLKIKTKILMGIFIGVFAVNILAWLAPAMSDIFGIKNWCDLYVTYITPIWVNIFCRITNIFPFSVGEIMIIAGLLLIFAMAVIAIFLIILRKKKEFRCFAKKFYYFCAYVLAVVCVVMTLNCTIMYHTTPLSGNLSEYDREYTINELEALRNYIVEKCNEYSMKMERDSDGYIIYNEDIQTKAKEALVNISNIYGRLSGYYPDVKHMMFSKLMCQAYMAGYYFPFSMEANCNSKMYIANYPEVYCHELAHLHGYIYEDEANFISYLACTNSEDEFFVYCGYLGVLNYVDNSYWDSIGEDVDRYISNVQINSLVYDDNIFLLEETWEEVEADAIISTDIIDEVSDTFTDVSLNLNGVKDGIASYGRVVELLLEYYDGILY